MLYLVLFLVAAVTRLLPHPPNVTAIVAVSAIAGAYVNPRFAWLVPLAALLATDIFFLEPYGATEMTFVYLGHAAAIGLSLLGGWTFVRSRQHRRLEGTPQGKGDVRTRSLLDGYVLCGTAGIAGIVFWTISNFGAFLVYYPQTSAGFANCYVLALPFLRNQVLGDVLITGGLFLAVEGFRLAVGPAYLGWGTRR